jgi:hypothetical protein
MDLLSKVDYSDITLEVTMVMKKASGGDSERFRSIEKQKNSYDDEQEQAKI